MQSTVVLGLTLSDWGWLLGIAASVATVVALFVAIRTGGQASTLPQQAGAGRMLSWVGLGALASLFASRPEMSIESLREIASNAPSFIDPTTGGALLTGSDSLTPDDIPARASGSLDGLDDVSSIFLG